MIRFLVLVWIYVSAPITLFATTWGLKLIYEAAGPVIFLIACASYVTSALGIAFLFDSRQSQDDQ